MKRLIIVLAALAPFFLAISSCNVEVPGTCDHLENQPTLNFKATVNAHYTDGTPVDGTVVRVLFYKLPCEQAAKGHQEYTYPLNSNGFYEAGPMTYNINWETDLIVAKLFINDGYENLEIYRQVDGVDLDHYPDGHTYTFDFTLDNMPL